jgi:hypothetical protein
MAADAGARAEPRLARFVRLLAVLVFAWTAFLPVHGCGPGPRPAKAAARQRQAAQAPAPEAVQVPFEEILEEGAAGWTEGGPVGAFWAVRVWYPYVLVPLWLAGLVLAAGGARASRAGGALLLGTTIAIGVFELGYISYQFRGFLPPLLRPLEVGVAWILVLAVLFLRRPGRRLDDPEATVSAHAFLSILHGLTYPVSDGRVWLDAGHDLSAIVAALLSDYKPAFWVALGALAVAAVPGYLFRPRGADGPAPPPPDS